MSILSRAMFGTFIGIGVLTLPTKVPAARAQQDTAQATQAAEQPPRAAVTVRGETLFYVQERVLSFSP